MWEKRLPKLQADFPCGNSVRSDMFIEIARRNIIFIFQRRGANDFSRRGRAVAKMVCAAPLKNKRKRRAAILYKHATPSGVCDTPVRVARPICSYLPKSFFKSANWLAVV